MTDDSRWIQQACDLIGERLGLDIARRTTITPGEILRRIAGERVRAYLNKLQMEPVTSAAWQRLIAELTLGETYFFRDQAQFRLLRTQLLPHFIQHNRSTRQLNIWCAGCATGEEAYSVAITLYETLPDFADWRVTVLGTDINGQALEIARQGFYRRWSFRHDDQRLLKIYFTPVDGGYQLNDTVRRMVTFRQRNLLDMPDQSWAHIILCRNVLLYFTEEARTRAEHILTNSLQSNGWLLLGHAEAIHDQPLQTHMSAGVLAYRKAQGARRILTDQPLALTGTLTRKRQPNTDTTPATAPYPRAVQAFQDERYDAAEGILAELLSRVPGDEKARILLAAIFANRGAVMEAHAHLNTALQDAPLNADAHYLRAMLYLEEGKESAAESALRAALYSQTGHPLAAFTLGNLHAKQDDPQRARNLWQQALDAARELPPDQPISDFNLRTAADFAALVQSQLLNTD